MPYNTELKFRPWVVSVRVVWPNFGGGLVWPYYVPRRRGGGHIVFGADPVSVGVTVGVGVGVGVTLSCLHDIS